MAPNYDETRERGMGALLSGLSALLKSEKFTDLTVKLDDRTWHVHKNVVCARSDFFVKACDGEFKEAGEGIITLHDDEPEVIDKMFHYMYNNQYEDADCDIPPVLLNVRMVAAAEKYFVDHLAHLAVSKLDYYTESVWGSEAFADAIEEAYTTTADSDRQLRDALLGVVLNHAEDLFDIEHPKYPHFQKMAAKTPLFSVEVAGLLAKVEGAQRREVIYRCPGTSCTTVFTSGMDPEVMEIKLSRTCAKCGNTHTMTCKDWQTYRRQMYSASMRESAAV